MKRSIEFIDELGRASDLQSMLTLLERTLASFGLRYFTFQDLPDPRHYEDFLFLRNVPEEWINLYIKGQYNTVDPAFRMCRQTAEPFIWASAPYDPDTNPQAAQFVRLVEEYGLNRGLMVPVPRLRGRSGVVWFGGPAPELNAYTIPSLQLVALYAFNRLRDIKGPQSSVREVNLSAREREVLVWTAAGKTAWETGEILGISKRTVDEYAKAAIAKLDVANRTHAIVLAIRDNLISV